VLTSTEYAQIPNSPGVHRTPQVNTGFERSLRKLLAIGAGWLRLRRYDYGITWNVDSISYAKRLVSEMGPCCVISTYPPLAVHTTALALKRRYPVRWIADFRDPLRNSFRPKHWAAQWADRYFEETIVRTADAILVNTDAALKELRERHPQYRNKIVLLSNGYDPEEDVHPLPPIPRETRLLVHIGTMYRGRHPNLLLDSLDRLAARGMVAPARLKVFLSHINEDLANLDVFKRLVKQGLIEYGNEEIPRANALRMIQEADFLLLLDTTPGKQSHFVPAKVFDYVRAGRPMLVFTTPGSPTDAIVRKSGIPHRTIFQSDPPERVDQMVCEFMNLPSDPAQPSDWFKETFDGSRQVEQLETLIESL